MSRKSSRPGEVHRCHLPGCRTVTNPRALFCKPHWAMVPAELAREVYATVGKRGPRVDATWAPWWKAQAQAAATLAVLRKLHTSDEALAFIARYEKREANFVAYLERRGT